MSNKRLINFWLCFWWCAWCLLPFKGRLVKLLIVSCLN